MTKTWWFAVVVMAAVASGVTSALVPHQTKPVEVHECGENSVRMPAPAGHKACALKNGQVINLRSTK